MNIREIPQRPAPMMPCTGCGECCRDKTCKMGLDAFPDAESICPALIWKNGRYWCALVKKEASEPGEKKIIKALGIGRGCYKNKNPQLYMDHKKDLLGVIEFINRDED